MTVIRMHQARNVGRWTYFRCAAWMVAGAMLLRLGDFALAAAHFFAARAKAAHDRAEAGLAMAESGEQTSPARGDGSGQLD